ncbi:hypothetical protein KA005_64585, partial [bacterium]|nr:hypothetical protein [bacterium]
EKELSGIFPNDKRIWKEYKGSRDCDISQFSKNLGGLFEWIRIRIFGPKDHKRAHSLFRNTNLERALSLSDALYFAEKMLGRKLYHTKPGELTEVGRLILQPKSHLNGLFEGGRKQNVMGQAIVVVEELINGLRYSPSEARAFLLSNILDDLVKDSTTDKSKDKMLPVHIQQAYRIYRELLGAHLGIEVSESAEENKLRWFRYLDSRVWFDDAFNKLNEDLGKAADEIYREHFLSIEERNRMIAEKEQQRQKASDQPAKQSVLDPWVKKKWGEESWKYRLYTTLGAGSWETLAYQLGGMIGIPILLIHCGLGPITSIVLGVAWATVWFSFSHTIIEWWVRAKEHGWRKAFSRDFLIEDFT